MEKLDLIDGGVFYTNNKKSLDLIKNITPLIKLTQIIQNSDLTVQNYLYTLTCDLWVCGILELFVLSLRLRSKPHFQLTIYQSYLQLPYTEAPSRLSCKRFSQ